MRGRKPGSMVYVLSYKDQDGNAQKMVFKKFDLAVEVARRFREEYNYENIMVSWKEVKA